MNLKSTDSMSIWGNNDNISSSRTNQVLLDNDNLVLFKNKYAAVINDTNSPQYDKIEERYPGITNEEVRIIALLRNYTESVKSQLFLSRERLALLKTEIASQEIKAPLILTLAYELKSLQKPPRWKPVIQKVLPVTKVDNLPTQEKIESPKTPTANQKIFDYLTREWFVMKPGIINEFVKWDLTLVVKNNKGLVSIESPRPLTNVEKKLKLEVSRMLKESE